MSSSPNCPACSSEYVYADGNLWVCPTCAHEWSQHEVAAPAEVVSATKVVRDAHGNLLQDGDSVTIVKDLKIKGSSAVVKAGTKVKNIRLIDLSDGHDLDCRIEGFGAMNLKSSVVKKA